MHTTTKEHSQKNHKNIIDFPKPLIYIYIIYIWYIYIYIYIYIYTHAFLWHENSSKWCKSIYLYIFLTQLAFENMLKYRLAIMFMWDRLNNTGRSNVSLLVSFARGRKYKISARLIGLQPKREISLRISHPLVRYIYRQRQILMLCP